jgi:hypothetical protein
MGRPREDTCGCDGKGKPLHELRQLIELMERKAMSTTRRIRSEIESYLRSSVMSVADDYWLDEERRSLYELLAMLQEEG